MRRVIGGLLAVVLVSILGIGTAVSPAPPPATPAGASASVSLPVLDRYETVQVSYGDLATYLSSRMPSTPQSPVYWDETYYLPTATDMLDEPWDWRGSVAWEADLVDCDKFARLYALHMVLDHGVTVGVAIVRDGLGTHALNFLVLADRTIVMYEPQTGEWWRATYADLYRVLRYEI